MGLGWSIASSDEPFMLYARDRHSDAYRDAPIWTLPGRSAAAARPPTPAPAGDDAEKKAPEPDGDAAADGGAAVAARRAGLARALGAFKREMYMFAMHRDHDGVKALYLYQGRFRLVRAAATPERLDVRYRDAAVRRAFHAATETMATAARWPLCGTAFHRAYVLSSGDGDAAAGGGGGGDDRTEDLYTWDSRAARASLP